MPFSIAPPAVVLVSAIIIEVVLCVHFVEVSCLVELRIIIPGRRTKTSIPMSHRAYRGRIESNDAHTQTDKRTPGKPGQLTCERQWPSTYGLLPWYAGTPVRRYPRALRISRGAAENHIFRQPHRFLTIRRRLDCTSTVQELASKRSLQNSTLPPRTLLAARRPSSRRRHPPDRHPSTISEARTSAAPGAARRRPGK